MRSDSPRFRIESFEPVKIRKAQQSLDKHFRAAQEHENLNETYKQSVFKETFWRKLARLFR